MIDKDENVVSLWRIKVICGNFIKNISIFFKKKSGLNGLMKKKIFFL